MSFKHAWSNRSLKGLLMAQFTVAFNDNYVKQVVLFFAARKLFPGEDRQGIAIMLFSVPFVLFSGYAGQISEKFSKQTIILVMKSFEILLAFGAAIAFYFASWPMLLMVLFVLSFQSAIMSPARYGILPEAIRPGDMVSANSMMAILTFSGILLGTAAAGPAFDFLLDQPFTMGGLCVVLALIGTLGATMIRRVPPQSPERTIAANPFSGLLEAYRETRGDRRIIVVVLTNSLLWMDGSGLVMAMTALGGEGYLAIPAWQISILSAVLALSIVAGCLSVPRLTRRFKPRVLISIGVIGAFIAQIIFVLGCTYLPPAIGYWVGLGSVMLIGSVAALAMVPIQTSMQVLPPPGMRGQVIALNNMLSFIAMFVAGLLYQVAAGMGLNPGSTMIFCGVLLVVCLWRWQPTLDAVELPRDDEASAEA